MHALESSEAMAFFLAIGILLAAARLLGEVARRLNQPVVVGELLAGVLLGPTLLGAYAPRAMGFLFPRTGPCAVALDGLSQLSVVLFLLVAGMEVDLSAVWRQGRSVISVSIAGIVVPFGLGFIAVWWAPHHFGIQGHIDRLVFALFFATALSISSLPVIAKTLMDLDLYRSDMGMTVIAAAIFDDVVGWIVFAVLAGMIGASSFNRFSIVHIVALTTGFSLAILVLGRWVFDYVLYLLENRIHWPGAILSFAFVVTLIGAAGMQWIGIHPIFGSFLVGVAIGDSPHLREKTRKAIEEFVSFVFAPLFFAGIGLKVNFAAHFDLALTVFVVVIASIGKVLGCGLGARLSGTSWPESWAIGFGMNSRGAMQIILGVFALHHGIIHERMFVALVTMAIVTSMTSGIAIKRLVTFRRPYRFIEHLARQSFLSALQARDRRDAIRELAEAASSASGLNSRCIESEVLKREEAMPTGISNGIAVPHARLDGLARPVVCLGISREGIDFDASDGEPARIIFLILTPKKDDAAQLELILDIMTTLKDRALREKLLAAADYDELVEAIRGAGSASRP